MFNPVVTIVERPAIKTAGLKIRSTMANASADCSKLWNDTFCPLMATFPVDANHPGESYGLSLMIDNETFDYWAVLPIAGGAAVPAGMEAVTIPAGPYAECCLGSLADMNAAYSYIYGQWNATNNQYSLNMQRMGYELYTRDYIEKGSLTIYCPLAGK